jgi:hypothetical protein
LDLVDGATRTSRLRGRALAETTGSQAIPGVSAGSFQRTLFKREMLASPLIVDPELSSPGRLACRFAVEKADSIPWVKDGYC